jgi:hypothetical protein
VKEAPQRFTLVEDSEPRKVQPTIDPIIKKRRSRLIWICIGIFLLFRLLNATGIISSGHFDREPSSDADKAFWLAWDQLFDVATPTPAP